MEIAFLGQWQMANLPTLSDTNEEYFFALSVGRDYRADFAVPPYMILIEIEGGTQDMGGHNRPDGFRKDARKYNLAGLLGWTVYRFDSAMVNSGEAIAFMFRVFDQIWFRNGNLAGYPRPDNYPQFIYDGIETVIQFNKRMVAAHADPAER